MVNHFMIKRDKKIHIYMYILESPPNERMEIETQPFEEMDISAPIFFTDSRQNVSTRGGYHIRDQTGMF